MAYASPIDVVVFAGAFGKAEHYMEILDAAQSVFANCSTQLFVAEDVVHDDWWAPYIPRESEIMFHVHNGLGYNDAVEAAHKWTYSADLSRIPKILEAVPPAQLGQKRIYVGFSNGVIPAAAAALHNGDALGLWVASGVATPLQMQQLQALQCCIAVSAARWETYWGGCRGVLWPWSEHTFTHVFEGTHARETWHDAVTVFSHIKDVTTSEMHD